MNGGYSMKALFTILADLWSNMEAMADDEPYTALSDSDDED